MTLALSLIGERMSCSSTRWTAFAPLAALAGWAAMLTASPQALAGDPAMAESLFRAGRALMAEGKVDQACPKFAESMRLDPAVGALLNLARCHERQGKTASAWAEYLEAATMARATGQLDRAEGARELAAELELRLSKLAIDASAVPVGLRILRNGVEIGPAARGVPVAVNPGSYAIEASAPGFRSWSTVIAVGKDGDRQDVMVPPLVPLGEDGDDGADGKSDIAHYALATTATGVGLVGVVLGTVFGLRAMTKWQDAQKQCPEAPEYCDATGVALSEEASDAATVSTVGFAIGGLGLAGAAALWLTAPDAPLGPNRGAASGGLRVVPIASDQVAGLFLVGEL